MNRPAGSLDISSALAPYSGPWNDRMAAHLLRRAGFGGSPQAIADMRSLSPHGAVESLIHFTSDTTPPPSADLFDPRLQYGPGNMMRLRGMDATQRKETLKGLRKEARQATVALQRWWLNKMLTTRAPLQEKMAFYFHGHFTTAAMQKGVFPDYVFNQNQLFRSYALGNLRELTRNVSKDPAMLIYLDNARSQKAHPNENYARELMELFTLGHGNYTEEDIRQSARAFTGWTIAPRTGAFETNARQHDDGSKTFLGQTGNFTGDDIVNIIFQQPACSKFFANSLLSFFVYDDPEPALVDAVANSLRKHNFELAPVLSLILNSNVFFSDRAYRARVKSPVEFVVGAYNTFGLTEIDDSAQRGLVQMGQVLFYPPNVAGWPGGQNWLTSQMLIARENFATALVNSQMMTQSPWLTKVPLNVKQATQDLITNILHGDASSAAVAQLQDYMNGANTSALGMFSGENYQERVRGAAYLSMAMPAYQLN